MFNRAYFNPSYFNSSYFNRTVDSGAGGIVLQFVIPNQSTAMVVTSDGSVVIPGSPGNRSFILTGSGPGDRSFTITGTGPGRTLEGGSPQHGDIITRGND